MASVITQVLLSRWTFIIFSIALVGYNVIGMYLVYSPEGSDYWEHLASMHSFSTNPASPPNPYILSDEPTHLFTPYHLFWGVISRILDVHVFWLFPVIAGVNILLFVASIRVFCRNILGDEKYVLAFALTMLFFWIHPWGWSGFYNFGLLPLTAIYPYWFTLPISLFVIAGYGESDIDGKWYNGFIPNILYGLAVCLVFLSHPLTGSFLILSLGVKVLTIKSIPRFERLALLTIPSLGLVLALFWPYFPVMSAILGSGSFAALGFAGNWELFYENAGWRILPALLGLPFLVYLLLKKKFTYVPVALVAVAGIYFFNYAVLHNSTLARYVIFIAFYCQVGVILSLKHLERHVRYNHVVVGFLLVTLILAIPQFILAARRIGPVRDIVCEESIGTHSNVTAFRQYSALRPYIGNTDVLMAPMKDSWQLAGVIGCRVVGVRHANPFMPDYFERKSVTEKFFTKEVTAADRSRILSHYSVSYVLVPKPYEAIISDFTAYLTLVYRDEEYALYNFKLQDG